MTRFQNEYYSSIIYLKHVFCVMLSLFIWAYTKKKRNGPGQGISTASKTTDGPRVSPLGDHMTGKDDKGDQPSGGDMT